jgi:uncharacterized protein (TIGR00304 family)
MAGIGLPMQWVRWLGLGFLIAGGALMAASVAMGQGQVSLLLIIPVFWGTGVLGFLAVTALFFGFVVLLFGPLFRSGPPGTKSPQVPTPTAPGVSNTPPSSSRYGGVVVVGPFPIAFGSDRQLATWMIVLGFAIAIGFVVLTILWFVNVVLYPSP